MKKNELSVFFHPWKRTLKILLTMKIILFLTGIFALTTQATVFSQATRMSIEAKDQTIRQIMQEIEEESEYRFFYNDQLANLDDRVDFIAEDITEFEAIERLFEGQELTFKLMENNLVLIMPVSLAQQIFVSGTIVDNEGNSLPGVSIYIKGTTRGTITNPEGEYTIRIDDPSQVLVFSYVGYLSQEIAIEDQTEINVTLREELTLLDEVVVVGYGSMKRANLTGAVDMVSGERLENRPITSVGHGLQGLIPNLNISIRNGDPTTSAEFNIRGYESINGGSPLILVDGVPMDIERINPNDIASVNVLKDASSAAVYGARAAFGVILVETKKARTGRIRVRLSTEQSVCKFISLVDPIMDPYKFVTAWNIAEQNTFNTDRYDADYVEGTRRWVENPTFENEWGVVNGVLRYYGNNDYKNKLYRDIAPQQTYDLSVSGGTENATYYASFGLLNKGGYLRNKDWNQNFKRYNILMKADFKVNNWLSLDEKIVLNARTNDEPHFYNWDVDINSAVRVTPIQPIQFPDLPYYVEPGDHDTYEQYIGMYFGTSYPYLEGGARTKFDDFDTWLRQGITLTPLKGLQIKSDFSYNIYHRNYKDVQSKIEVVSTNLLDAEMIDNGFSTNDYINEINDYNRSYMFNAYADYTFQTDRHYMKAMVGYNQEWFHYKSVRAQGNEMITPMITDLSTTIGRHQVWGGESHTSLRGLFYRLNYIYKDKYLIELNGRYDGTSRFPKDDRFGFFPSFAAAWRISEESFMEGTRNFINNLKLRASYGVLGNQLIGDSYYPYISTMPSGIANYMLFPQGGIPNVNPPGLVSPTLTWETVTTQNLGLDFSILKQRLHVLFDIYKRETKDMLMNVSYPSTLGTDAPKENAADLKTNGWEISIHWIDKIGQNWRYGAILSMADNQTEITKYDNPSGAISDYYVGKKIGEIWAYDTEGIFQTDEEVANHADQAQLGTGWKTGDIKYADLNNDGRITPGSNTLNDPGDRKIVGNASARYSFGISPKVSYKNLSLDFFFQGLFRDYLPPGLGNWVAFYPFKTNIAEDYYLTDTWTPDNPDAYFAAAHVSHNNPKNTQPQSRYVQNAAYIRLKNLRLGYTLPQNLVNKVGMYNIQVYFSGQNLWEYSKIRKPLDPEQITTLVQEYWFQRIFAFGISITL